MSDVPLDVFAISMGAGALIAGAVYLTWRVHVALMNDYPAEIRGGIVYPVGRRKR